MENMNSSQNTQPELDDVINDLQRGRNWASHLDTLFQDSSGSNAQILIQEIKGCFSRAITTLSSSNQANEFLNPLQLSAVSQVPSRTRNGARVGATSQQKVFKENPNDCYAWRIYGQKEVPNSIYPRFYYECARKDELNCCATKRVRCLRENPSLYEIVYYDQHTCMQLPNEQ